MTRELSRVNLIDVGFYCGLSQPWSHCINAVDELLVIDPLIPSSLGGKVHVIKRAIYDINGVKDFYITEKETCSSLLKIDHEFLKANNIPNNGGRYDVKSTIALDCVRLDNVLSTMGIEFDFIKSDTQGTDVNVIVSMGSYLQDMVGIHIELYKKPFYKDSITFDRADKILNQHGFTFQKTLRRIKNSLFDDYLYLNLNTTKKSVLNTIKYIYGLETKIR